MRNLAALFALAFALLASPALAQQAEYNATAKTFVSGTNVPVQTDVNGRQLVVASGDTADDAVDSGNPVKVGGIVRTTLPSYSVGDRSSISLDARSRVIVTIGPTDSGTGGYDQESVDSTAVSSGFIALRANALLYGFDGTNKVRMRGDANGLTVLPGLSSTYWSYTNGATGILSNTTTAVTIKASAGGALRNYIDSCTITTTAFGATVPLVIRDGAGGTVIWSINVPTAGILQPAVVTFPMPLRGTAATLLEVATPTANTSGTVWISCQGHTGT